MARARANLGNVEDFPDVPKVIHYNMVTKMRHRWPVFIRRLENFDTVGPNESWDITPSDLPAIVDFIWEFVRDKEYRPVLIIQPGLPLIVTCAIMMRLSRHYRLILTEGVVVYSTLSEYPIGSQIDF